MRTWRWWALIAMAFVAAWRGAWGISVCLTGMTLVIDELGGHR